MVGAGCRQGVRPALVAGDVTKRYYPLFLDVEGERCLVVGAGRTADEKAEALERCGARVDRIEPTDYRPERLTGARVVVDCSGDDQVGQRIHADAEARGILVNVLDRTPWCRFIAPAVVDRHPLQVAISTGGESPFLAAALRRRLEALLPPEWGDFVALVGRVRRELRRQAVPLADQTTTYRRLLAGPVRSLLADGDHERAHAEEMIAATGAGRPRLGLVTLVGAGPGDDGLLTLSALEALADADIVFHDALVPARILGFARPDAEIVDVGKRAGRPSARQADINRSLIEAARDGRQVVRLKGGDPFIFGRGGEEAEALVDAGIPVRVVSGVSSALAAPAAAGIPLTMRGLASSVAIVTATGDGGDGRSLREIAAAADTLVVLMALGSLDEVATELGQVLGPDRPAAVVAHATLPDQRTVRGSLRSIARLARAAGLDPPATLIVGEVVAALSSATSQAVV